MWVDKKYIIDFLEKKDYDIRKSHNARWIDQKCTPDVVSIVCDCILNFIDNNDDDLEFTVADIWHNEYTRENVYEIFSKPDTESSKAENEYDKYFGQPIKMLGYSGILIERVLGNRNYYRVNDRNLLEFLSLKERNSLTFLYLYNNKVLKDSGIYFVFESFFANQNKSTFSHMKTAYENFIIHNTPINGVVECRRIFTKVLNPIAFSLKKKGTERGRLSEFAITYDMLMYNRDNFRDVYANKPKDMTRKEYELKFNIKNNENKFYYKYLSNKAKNYVRKYNIQFNNQLSEIPNSTLEKATHIHHIFPEADFPTICHYLENLIALQPNQHLIYAHPNGNTQLVSSDFQRICLLAKTNTIQNDYSMENDFYDFEKFIDVLFIGLNEIKFKEIEYLDFDELVKEINLYYDQNAFIF